MVRGHQTLLLLLSLLVWMLPAGASARPLAIGAPCHAVASELESYARIAGTPSRWRCDTVGWDATADSTVLRFDLGNAPGRELPQSLTTHTGHFERIDIGVVDRHGGSRWMSYWPRDMHHLATGPYMVAALPYVEADSRAVVVRVVRPWGKTMLSEMRLDSTPDGTGWPLDQIVAMAAICGMLVVPLFLNAAFYSALPERYVIWHLVMVAAMLTQACFATGFVHLVFADPAPWEWQVSNVAFVTMGAAALMFTATYIEPDRLSRRLRRLMTWLAPLVFVTGLAASLPYAWMRPLSAPMIHVALGLVMLVVTMGVIDAWRRGSTAVYFQVAGWTPAVLVGAWRVACFLLPFLRPTEAIVIYQLALATEVLATALGIISRFIDLRRQRDSAMDRARVLEGVAGRDPLTGLSNRRSIERRFDELFRMGFRTMAVIDLDHFKTINDTHGHARGDEVLRAAAAALIDDRDTRAIRIGGEEFLLLLRGSDAADRAERCRRAITSRISADVPGLDRAVTASMGLVEHDTKGTLEIEFTALYARCDRLLYEAKRLGRNRMMREKVTGFSADSMVHVAG